MLVIGMTLLFAACEKPLQFEDEGPFLELRYVLLSEAYYLDFFPKKVAVYEDGIVRLYTEETVDRYGNVDIKVNDDAPVVEKVVPKKEIEKLQTLIEKNDIMSMSEDLSDYEVMDGSGTQLTIYTVEKEKSIRADNTRYEPYIEITDYIYTWIEDDYPDWYKETKQYIYDLNEN